MGRVHEVLHWANRRAVAEEVTRRGYRVSGETLNRWVRDEKEFPAMVERIVFDLFGITNEPPEPAWLEGLVREIRMNREAIREAMLGPDQPNDAALVEMVKNDLRPLFEGLAAQFQGEVRQLLAERFGETDED